MSNGMNIGLIHISDNIVSTIAGLAALATPELAAMSGGVTKGLTKRLSGKVSKGVYPS